VTTTLEHASGRDLLDDCVHCGFCLPTCPTYLLWGQETDSPRGRIHLMKLRRDGRETASASFVQHIDTCLGCMACVTACPSGVQYDSLLEAARPQVEREAKRGVGDRLFRRLIFATFPYPGRLRALTWPLGLYQKFGIQRLVQSTGLLALLPRLQAMERLLPPITVGPAELPERIPAQGPQRKRVALLLGCVQRVFFSNVNEATARVLAAEGCEVIVPQAQACCGALAEHAGEEEDAMAAARKLIDAFEDSGADTIVINAAGCGSAMKRYGHLLRNDPAYAAKAKAFGAKCRDISEVLVDLEPRAPRGAVHLKAAYHDACHLQHAQGVRAQPRRLLQSVPGVEVREIPESEICCGSAGIYNLLEPEAAAQLRDRKVRNILGTDAEAIVSGNPGCLLQIATGLEAAGRRTSLRQGYGGPPELPRRPMRIMHLVEVLDQSIREAQRTN
jgi:glycolate oxidase iron-sulfur subunit